jgi:hypothetical protein
MPQISERSWLVLVVKVCTFKPFSCTQVSGSNDLHASKTTLILVSEISWVPLLSKVLFQLELSIMWRFSQMHFGLGGNTGCASVGALCLNRLQSGLFS